MRARLHRALARLSAIVASAAFALAVATGSTASAATFTGTLTTDEGGGWTGTNTDVSLDAGKYRIDLSFDREVQIANLQWYAEKIRLFVNSETGEQEFSRSTDTWFFVDEIGPLTHATFKIEFPGPFRYQTTEDGVTYYDVFGFYGFHWMQLHASFGPSETVAWRMEVTQTGVIPEPASWALMIGGFGFAGAALRRAAQYRQLV